MLSISIPDYGQLDLRHLVLDYNGVLAVDGQLIRGVRAVLQGLSQELQVHVVTADTFGTVRKQLAGGPWKVVVLAPDRQAEAKRDYVEALGAGQTACVGNGRNDQLMLRVAALGFAVIQKEGAAVQALREADVICPDALSALELLAHPKRLVATLRC